MFRNMSFLLGIHAEKSPSQSSTALFYYWRDRKSTRLNSSHLVISYAVFCLKKNKKILPVHLFVDSVVRVPAVVAFRHDDDFFVALGVLRQLGVTDPLQIVVRASVQVIEHHF